MKTVNIAITAASFCGNKGAAAMLQSSIDGLYKRYGRRLRVRILSTYPSEDRAFLRQNERYGFVQVVNASPARLMFCAFPLAVLYSFLRFVPLLGLLLRKNAIIRAYCDSDIVIDEAGISFADSRGFVMNTYAFVCASVPMLCGVPVVKYSQALGGFKNPWNRLLSRLVLPKMGLICARGEITQKALSDIGITRNVRQYADGAFSLEIGEEVRQRANSLCEDAFFGERVVGVSVSSVVEKKCRKLGKDYHTIMAEFIDELNSRGFNVLIIAAAARENTQKPRNNDLPVCGEVYGRVCDKSRVRWYPRDMRPEELHVLISRCVALVSSRFHAMIFALCEGVPAVSVGWGHKYKEVLDMFGMGGYAVDYAELSKELLLSRFFEIYERRARIREKILEKLPEVKESSKNGLRLICEYIDALPEKRRKPRLLDYSDPDRYIGGHICCRMGYATDENIRKGAASGGVVTALLAHLLRAGEIDGAWVTKSVFENGKPSYRTFIATTPEQLLEASSSVYMYVPLTKHIKAAEEFRGRLAVVLLPCQMKSLNEILGKNPALNERIVLKIGLFCSGAPDENATIIPLMKKKIPTENAVCLKYRQGHWRGRSAVIYADGSARSFSYIKTFGAYKNAYFFARKSCLICQDHFCLGADISFGDIWTKQMKKQPIKHTCCVIRSERALKLYQSAVKAGAVADFAVSDEQVISGQKRALVFKFNCAAAKRDILAKSGKTVRLDDASPCRINHRLAAALAFRNSEASRKNPRNILRLPLWAVNLYMCFIRFLLSF